MGIALTRNNSDGGIQCLKTSPYQVPSAFTVPIVLEPSLTKNLISDCLTTQKISHPYIYYEAILNQ